MLASARAVGELDYLLGLGSDRLVAALANDLVFDVRGARPGARRELAVGLGCQLVVEILILVLGGFDEVGLGVVAEDEPDPVGVPAVKLCGQREVGVAPEQDVGEPGLAAQLDRAVIQRHDPLMGGTVSAVQRQIQRLGGVRERDHQRRVTPDAVVGDVHSLLALPVGFDDRGVRVDPSGLREERRGLL